MTKFLSSCLLLASLVTTPLFAEPAPVANVIVRTADLDLGSAAGQRLLDRRLASAVVDACGTASRVDLAGSNEVRRCRDETRTRIATDRARLIELASRSSSIVIAAR